MSPPSEADEQVQFSWIYRVYHIVGASVVVAYWVKEGFSYYDGLYHGIGHSIHRYPMVETVEAFLFFGFIALALTAVSTFLLSFYGIARGYLRFRHGLFLILPAVLGWGLSIMAERSPFADYEEGWASPSPASRASPLNFSPT